VSTQLAMPLLAQAEPALVVAVALAVLLLAVLYFVPTIIGAVRKVPDLGSLVVINVFLGWTFAGWVVALAMAFRSRQQAAATTGEHVPAVAAERPPLRVGAALSDGWRAFLRNWDVLVALTGIVLGAAAGFGLVVALLEDSRLAAPVAVIGLVVVQGLLLGHVRAAITIVDGHRPTLRTLVERPDRVVAYLVATVVFALLALMLSLLLVVPGIVYIVAHALYAHGIVDPGDRPLQALRRSRAITRGSRWGVFGLLILVAAMNTIGALLFGIGLLVSLPVSAMALAHAYRTLSQQPAPTHEPAHLETAPR
jgi:hypothetical protein